MANEKRLIDADALIDWMTKPTGFRCNCDDCPDIDCLHCIIEDCIKKAPTVDAVEVVHGRWKYYHKQNIAVCTNCSFERDLDANFGKAISCPNCGAKMDGDGNG